MSSNVLGYSSQINGLDVLVWMIAAAVYHLFCRPRAEQSSASDSASREGQTSMPARRRHTRPTLLPHARLAVVHRPAPPRRIYVVARREASLRREALRSRWSTADLAQTPPKAARARRDDPSTPRLAA